MVVELIKNMLNGIRNPETKRVVVRCGSFEYDISKVNMDRHSIWFDIDPDSRKHVIADNQERSIGDLVKEAEAALDSVEDRIVGLKREVEPSDSNVFQLFPDKD